MYTVYAIYNEKHKKIYVGQTKNLNERLILHNNHVFYKGFTTRFDGEWKIIYSEIQASREESLRREKQLKSYQGRQFIKKFIPR